MQAESQLMYFPPNSEELSSFMLDQQLDDAFQFGPGQWFDADMMTASDYNVFSAPVNPDTLHFGAVFPDQDMFDLYPPPTLHSQHLSHYTTNYTIPLEQKMSFQIESWPAYSAQGRIGSPVDTESSYRSGSSNTSTSGTTPTFIPLAQHHHLAPSFQHLGAGSGIALHEIEPASLLPAPCVEVDVEFANITGVQPTDALTSHATPAESGVEGIEEDTSSDEQDDMTDFRDDKSDADSDYRPSRPSASDRRASTGRSKLHATTQSKSKVVKRTLVRQPLSPVTYRAITAASGNVAGSPASESTYRPFTCPGRPYGCHTTFTSKNEWKRHVISQHFCLGYWRCDLCSDLDTSPNDFNRKDLFTQHLRRMHTPLGPAESSTAAGSKGNSRRGKARPKVVPKDEEFEQKLEQIRDRCWVQAREPPKRLTCKFCDVSFAGKASCEDYLEHVGRHLAAAADKATDDQEQLHKDNSAVFEKDDLLRQWLAQSALLRHSRTKPELVGGVTVDRSGAASPAGAADAEGDPE